MNIFKTFGGAALAALSGGRDGRAGDVINTAPAGNQLSFNWSNVLGNGVDITGTGTMTATIVGGALQLVVRLNNNTVLLNAGDNTALVSFGFGITPNATSVVLSAPTDNGFARTTATWTARAWLVSRAAQHPQPAEHRDLRLRRNGNCSGGDVNEGVQAGNFDDLILTLGGNWVRRLASRRSALSSRAPTARTSSTRPRPLRRRGLLRPGPGVWDFELARSGPPRPRLCAPSDAERLSPQTGSAG